MAVTRSGVPIQVWTWPGNTGDSPLIRQVKDDLRAWRLGRVVWVTDRGFASAANRRYLQRAGGHYICGEKLRGDSPALAVTFSVMSSTLRQYEAHSLYQLRATVRRLRDQPGQMPTSQSRRRRRPRQR